MSNGTAAIRFVTLALASYFKRLFNGIEVNYKQFGISNRDPRQQVADLMPLSWFTTHITVKYAEWDKRRAMD